ncbi:MAG: hypothetical protein LBK47_09510 [Prevotellaceae bacterium]|jgi:hypothetical protein|nr:hypothetical protein [Prevotellaceae bacterium]
MWTDWEKKAKPDAKIPSHLLWDVDLKKFDWEAGKSLVVERVIERGDDQDFYTIFRMYGGVDGVREIAKNIKQFTYPQDISFVCMVFDLKKEELECYKQPSGATRLSSQDFREMVKYDNEIFATAPI